MATAVLFVILALIGALAGIVLPTLALAILTTICVVYMIAIAPAKGARWLLGRINLTLNRAVASACIVAWVAHLIAQ